MRIVPTNVVQVKPVLKLQNNQNQGVAKNVCFEANLSPKQIARRLYFKRLKLNLLGKYEELLKTYTNESELPDALSVAFKVAKSVDGITRLRDIEKNAFLPQMQEIIDLKISSAVGIRKRRYAYNVYEHDENSNKYGIMRWHRKGELL